MTLTSKLRQLAGLLWVTACITSCSDDSTVDSQEVSRLPSPDMRVQAVLVSKNAGATVATVTELYVVPSGGVVKKENLILRADHVQNAIMNWKTPMHLEFRYETARIFHFSNFWQSKDVDNFEYTVEVTLRPPENHDSLPVRKKAGS